MRNIDDYLDAARQIEGISSDAELARRLGLNPPAVNGWRKKRTWPSDSAMCTLARLANIDPKVALIELNIWRAQGPAALWYSEILKTVAVLLIVTISGMSTFPEQVNIQYSQSLYYGKWFFLQYFRALIHKALILLDPDRGEKKFNMPFYGRPA